MAFFFGYALPSGPHPIARQCGNSLRPSADVQRRSGPFAQVPLRQLQWGFPFRTPFGLILAPSRQPGSHEVASPVIGPGEGGESKRGRPKNIQSMPQQERSEPCEGTPLSLSAAHFHGFCLLIILALAGNPRLAVMRDGDLDMS